MLVSACPRPFAVEHVEAVAPAGATIAEIMALVGIEPPLIGHAHVFIGDWRIEQAYWPVTRPREGQLITIRVVPMGGGGGKNPLRILLAIAVVAAAAWAAAALGPAFGIGLFGPDALGLSIGTSMALGQALVGGAVTLVGNLLVNAIAPPPRPRLSDLSGRAGLERTSPTLAITGSQNRVNPYGPVPRVYGRTRVFPVFAALPYSEVQGADQYFRLLFDFGYGPLALSDLRIGTTPLTLFEGVETEVRYGHDSDPPITLYANTIHEDAYSIQLTQAGGPRSIETRDGANEAIVDLSFRFGLVDLSSGSRASQTVQILVEHRPAGSAGGFTSAGVQTITAASEQLVQQGVRIAFPASGRYELRFTRQTADSTAIAVRNESFVTALRSVTYTPPATPPGRCRVAMRIKASNQLNGVVQAFNAIAESLLPVWDGVSFNAPQLTRNPAWVALDILRGTANKRPVADSRIDLASFKEFAAFCEVADQAGEPRFRFDAVFDARTTVFQAVNDILATARAQLSMKDGRFSVVWDRPQSSAVQYFSPRNSRGFRGTKVFATLPHGLKCRYIEPERDWSQHEVIVYADSYSAANATLFETIEMYGVTRAEQAWRDGRYHLAVGQLRPEVYELEADLEHLVCQRGDLVRVAHDVPRWGLAAGRIKSLTTDGGGNASGITLDEVVTLEAGKAHAVRIRRSDGASVLATVTPVGTTIETPTLALSPPILANDVPAIGDLAMVGEQGKETVELLVKSIRHRGLDAVLELVDAAPTVHAADTVPIPAFDTLSTFPGQGLNLNPPVPRIDDLRSDEEAMIRTAGGGWQTAIRLTLSVVSGVAFAIDHLEIQLRRVGSGDDWRRAIFPGTPRIVHLTEVDDGEIYDLRLRHVTAAGRASDWAPISNHMVVGKSSPPPDVAFLDLSGDVLVWSYADPPRDFAGFKVYYNAGANTKREGALDATSSVVLAEPRFDVSRLPRGPITFLVVAVDTSGNESLSPAVVVRDLGDPYIDNIVDLIDLKAAGFPGTVTGGTLSGGNLLADADGTLYLPDGSAQYLPDSAASYLPVSYVAMTYQPIIVPEADAVPGRMMLDLGVEADGWSIELRRHDQGPYLLEPNAAYLPDGAAPYLGGIGPWGPWPGALDATREAIELRLTTFAGNTSGTVSGFTVQLDVPDEREKIEDFSLPVDGARLPLSKAYRSIRLVRLTLQDDGGAADTLKLVDKDATLGPLVKAFAAGIPTSARIDAEIVGVRA